MKGILLSSPVNSWSNFKRFQETQLKLSYDIGFVYRRTDMVKPVYLLLFYPVLEFVVSDFLSNKALLLPDLYKKIEDLADKTVLIKSLKEPEDKIGEPSPIRGNKFSHLSLEDFKETGDETFAWKSFEKKLSAYRFLKYLVQENDIHVDLPGLKTFLSFSETDTEKSEFCSIEVLDETADSKATVLKTLNILHKKFQIGIKLQYQVVVGDRKSYDYLIKLKSEYRGSLSWVLPYPGDWHILFINLIFYQINNPLYLFVQLS